MTAPRTPTSRGRLLTAAFLALTGSELAYFVGVGVMIPVIPLFAAGPLGVGPIRVGVAVGLFSVTALALRPVAGRLSDRWGSGRLVLVGALLFTAFASTLLLVSQYWSLLAVRLALGVAEAVFFVAGMAALADMAPADRMGEAISYNSLGLYVGIALGPVLGEWLLRVGGFQAAWIGVVCLGAISALLALKVPRLPPATGTSPPLLPRRLIGPGLAFLVGLSGAAGFLGFAALYARDVGLRGAGMVLFGYGAVVVVGRVVFARFSDRFAPAWLSAWALLWCSAGLGVMSLVRTPLGFIGGAVVLAIGVTFLTPAFYRQMMARLPSAHRGAAAATFSIAVDLGLGGGPILFGLIVRQSSIPVAFATAAALALSAAVIVAVTASVRR